MKIGRNQLRKIIKEEIRRIMLHEQTLDIDAGPQIQLPEPMSGEPIVQSAQAKNIQGKARKQLSSKMQTRYSQYKSNENPDAKGRIQFTFDVEDRPAGDKIFSQMSNVKIDDSSSPELRPLIDGWKDGVDDSLKMLWRGTSPGEAPVPAGKYTITLVFTQS